MNVDCPQCRNCGTTLSVCKRRGSPKVYCSARCRKAAWLKIQSVPLEVGHVAQNRERFGRITDQAGKATGISGRTVRRLHELDGLVADLFGPEKVAELHESMRAGRTAPIYTMLKAAKQMALNQEHGGVEC